MKIGLDLSDCGRTTDGEENHAEGEAMVCARTWSTKWVVDRYLASVGTKDRASGKPEKTNPQKPPTLLQGNLERTVNCPCSEIPTIFI
jgi:hypothetical protein